MKPFLFVATALGAAGLAPAAIVSLSNNANSYLLTDAYKIAWQPADYSSGGTMVSQHQIQVSSVPEPSAAMVWVWGAGILIGTRRSRA